MNEETALTEARTFAANAMRSDNPLIGAAMAFAAAAIAQAEAAERSSNALERIANMLESVITAPRAATEYVINTYDKSAA